MQRATVAKNPERVIKTAARPVGGAGLQRKCACGGVAGPSGECESCRSRRLQRKAAAPEAGPQGHAAVPPIVQEVLRSPGQPLAPANRAFMEAKFEHDFSDVRVHADGQAAESASAVDALAYTVGRDVILGPAGRASDRGEGRRLLAHELAHVVQQRGSSQPSDGLHVEPPGGSAEREAEEASQIVGEEGPVHRPLTPRAAQLARQPRTSPPPATNLPAASSAMTRADFENTVQQRFGVQTVRTGTLAEQERGSTRRGAPIAPRLDPAAWRSWDPGGSSEVYRWILSSLESVSANFGGIPAVREIVFFEVEYEQDTTTGAVIAHPDVGASYGGGLMTIYHSGISSSRALPSGRSSTRPPANRPVISVQTPGSSPGADLPLPSAEQSGRRTITHELGHGLAETALTPPGSGGAALDNSMMDDYKAAVGWIGPRGSERLFDIGAEAVRDAVRGGTPPGATFEITEAHWNDPRWVEQPISGYMVAGGPSEDFAEAVSTYVNEPATLRARSPRRYKFLEERKARWRPGLRQPTAAPAGPAPSGPSVQPPAPARPRFGPLYEPRRDFNPEILKSAEDL